MVCLGADSAAALQVVKYTHSTIQSKVILLDAGGVPVRCAA